MRKKNHPPFASFTIQDNLIQHNGYWLIAMRIQSIDIDNKSDSDKEATLLVFQNILKSLPSQSQVIFRKTPLDFSAKIFRLEHDADFLLNKKVKEYANSYIDYIKEVTKNKLDKVNYLILKTAKRCAYEEGRHYLEGVMNTISQAFSNLNMKVVRVEGKELDQLYALPDFIKEEVDYFVYGGEMRRTYVIKDYPRTAYPNWLKPIFDYQYPVELTQHFHPMSRSSIIKNLEMLLAKLQSTMSMQEQHGDVVSSELKVRHADTLDLLKRLASGEDLIVETSFYITVSAPDLETLHFRSAELESYMRQCGLVYRTCRRQVYRGVKSMIPLCDDHQLDTYTFDTRSLATLLPFTVQDFVDKDGIIYGMSSDLTEMICMDLWKMPNPNKIILGKAGFGKSMLAKTETARHIINGVQAIILDHDGEWKTFCEILGGTYINDIDSAINWNSHLLVFSGEIKVQALEKAWNKIKQEDAKQRVLIIEEFHNILRKNKELLLIVAKEVRKTGTAPTFITQNVRDFIRTEEGQMIFDNCSIKVFLRQGENDLQEVERLFNLSKSEKSYLSICPIGYGYLYTDLYKTKFKVDYSEREEEILSTNPLHKIRRKTT